MNALAPFDVYWVEEPLEPEELKGYQRLAGRTPLRFAAGEACDASPELGIELDEAEVRRLTLS
jgi:L-alanine-DL-glutamate epimerase-like enolase superfamily enzyme